MCAVTHDQIVTLIARTVDIPNQTERFDDWFEKRSKGQTILNCRAPGNIEAAQVGVQQLELRGRSKWRGRVLWVCVVEQWRMMIQKWLRNVLNYCGGPIFSKSENLSRTFQKKPRQKRGFLSRINLIELR